MKASARNTKPLAGLRVLVGRARHQASTLSSGLKALGAEVIKIPFIEIRPPRSYKAFDSALRNSNGYDWLILTSVNSVDVLAARMKRLRIKASTLDHLQIAAIGPATRATIEALGLRVAVVPERYIAESMVDALRSRVKGKRLLLARAKFARDIIPRELRKVGARVDVIEAYETVVPAGSKQTLRALMDDPAERPNVVCFTSSSTARNFAAMLGKGPLQALVRPKPTGRESTWTQFASIGPVTSATLREFGLSVHIEAREYTIPGLIAAVVRAKGALQHDRTSPSSTRKRSRKLFSES
jgi:uroporphyrinogen-III synthase